MANRKLYALLIGIDEYLGGVRPLRGCKNDVKNVESMLNDLFGNTFSAINIKKLVDGEATRDNIINAFQSHLIGQATSNDVIYFHFSGHGSQEKAPKEFFEFDAKDKNETLVCVDSRLPGKYDLADKEMGVLLHLASQKTKNIIMVADSCHSGTINRGDDVGGFRPRFEEENPSGRNYDTYLNGYLKANNILKVPEFEGVVFAACADAERAQEDIKNQCGLFTSNFVKTLRDNHGVVSYSELYMSIRSRIESLLDSQHPQFDLGTNTSAHLLFLSDKTDSTQGVGHSVYQMRGAWRISAGAAHGLPQDGSEFPIEIYGKENKTVAKGIIKGISIASSSVEITEGKLENEKIYRGMTLNAPVMPLKVYVKDDSVRKILEDQAATQMGRSFVKLEKNDLPSEFSVEYCDSGMFQLKYKKTGILLGETPDTATLNKALAKIEKKNRFSRLKNLNTSLDPDDFVLEVAATNVDGQISTLTNPDVSLDFQNIDGQWRKVPIQIRLENKSYDDLHFMLLHLSSMYGVKAYFDLMLPAQSGKKTVFAKPTSLNIKEPHLNETVDEFLLIVSDEKLDKFDFEQTEIMKEAANRDIEIEEDWNNKWLTKKIAIKLVRQQNAISSQGFALNGGAINIKGHNALSANVSLNSSGTTRDISTGKDSDIANVMEKVARAQGGEIFALSNATKTGDAQKILELTNIQNADKILAQNPLILEINANLKANEMILPLSFDGEKVIPVGFPTKNENGVQTIHIERLPQISEPTRSTGGALKMAFMKISLPSLELNKLKWIDYSGATPTYKTDGLAAKVAKAKNILLLVHGILGDTKDMAKAFPFVVSEKIYDLVLAYDYESLHTPIEKTAENLKKSLEAVGINAAKGKALNIVSHSMGGLVSRYLIEKLGGNAFVNKLIMAGTPNNGSPFGTLTDYRKWAMMNLMMAANLAKDLPSLASIINALNTAIKSSEKLTASLDQMKPNCTFLKSLTTTKDPNVKYMILAGNAELMKKERDGSFFERLNNKSREEMSDFFSKSPNDMAVLVSSALTLPKRTSKTIAKEVAAFHLTFFDSPVLMQQMKDFMKE